MATGDKLRDINPQDCFVTTAAGAIVGVQAGADISTAARFLNEAQVTALLAGGAGAGTVTATAGALTANALVLGAGGTDEKVSTGLTSNGAGEISLGVAGTTAGAVNFAGSTSGLTRLKAPAVAVTGDVVLPSLAGTLARLEANTLTGAQTLPTGYPPKILFGTDTTTGYYQASANSLNATVSGLASFTLGGPLSNTFFGHGVASASSVSGTGNCGFGRQALVSLTTGLQNVAVGQNAGLGVTTSSGSVYLGVGAGQAANASGLLAIGSYALANAVTTAQDSVGLGTSALNALTTGDQNVAVGASALQSTQTGRGNTAIGYGALLTLGNNTSGLLALGNVAIGNYALRFATSGYENTGIGYLSLSSVTTGFYNIGIGAEAVDYCTTGSNNIGVGVSSLQAVTTGSNNVGVGFGAGGANVDTNKVTTGSLNTFLGSQAKPGSATARSYQMVLGADAVGVDASNSVTLGRPGSDLIYAGLIVSGIKSEALTTYTAAQLVAAFPASANIKGARAYVSDALTPTFLGVLVGGGSVVSPVFCNGTAWVTA